MTKLLALLKLVRWPNLVFIALAQFLVYCFLVYPGGKIFRELIEEQNLTNDVIFCFASPYEFNLSSPVLLVISTVLIAAAGYMINDYFDIRIDAVNKPDKLVLSKIISRKAMITWHVILNIVAVLLVVKLAYENQLRLISIQLFCITALVVYSMSFKRKLFIGNLLVGVLIGLSILLVGIYEPNFRVLSFEGTFAKLLWLYAIFAFLITLIREVVKDAEDMRGDLREGCRTIPIVYGLAFTKKVVYIIYALLLGLVAAFIAKLFHAKPVLCFYFILGIILPSFFIIWQVLNARRTSDFAKISSYIKWLTLSGILSMILIQF